MAGRGLLWLLAAAGLAATLGAADEQRPLGKSSDILKSKNPFTSEFSELVNKSLHHWKVPGISIAVIDDDDVYAEGFGFATLPDTPATPETLWYGASTSKAQLAATIAHFIDTKAYPQLSQGWQTPISSIIRDDFVLQDEWATNHITLDDAVSHRTGMPRHDLSSVHDIDGRQATARDVVRNLRNLPTIAEPRTEWHYCNLMFVTLSHVVETLTGKWLGDVLREVLWAPLDMNATFFTVQDAHDAPNHFARGYAWHEDSQDYAPVPYMEVSEVSGAGSVISNVLDYAKWVKCLLHQAAPFSESTHKDIQTPRMMVGMPNGGFDAILYGLGWERTTYNGHVLYTHNGGMHAYGAEVYWFPDAKYGVVAFANTAGTSNAVEQVLAFELIADKLGIPEDNRYNFTEKWHTDFDKQESLEKTLPEMLFPNTPEPPLPPTINISQLAGSYFNDAYGKLKFREEADQENEDQVTLVADRPDATWKYQMRLRHVSSDYWIAYIASPGFYDRVFGAAAAEFKIGADGKVVGLEVDMRDSSNLPEGKFCFHRIE